MGQASVYRISWNDDIFIRGTSSNPNQFWVQRSAQAEPFVSIYNIQYTVSPAQDAALKRDLESYEYSQTVLVLLKKRFVARGAPSGRGI